MGKKLKGRALARYEAGRDVWQEVFDGVREIKAGGGKRVVVDPRSPIVRARLRADHMFLERAMRWAKHKRQR